MSLVNPRIPGGDLTPRPPSPPANGAIVISSAPAPASASAARPHASARGALSRRHSSAPMATNQTSTDRSTWPSGSGW